MEKVVPKPLVSDLFFPSGKITESNLYFPHEIQFYEKENSDLPWLDESLNLNSNFEQWKQLKLQLSSMFRNRDKNVLEPMKKGLELFICSLFWANNQPASLQQEALKTLSLKPVNVEERLQFIFSRPKLYHSFIQLNELMEELEKQYVKMLALKSHTKKV